MKINGIHYQSIWLDEKNDEIVHIIDQTRLPFEFRILDLTTSDEAVSAIKNMKVRGAPLIGLTAVFGIYLAVCESIKMQRPLLYLKKQAEKLAKARPTAVDLGKSVHSMMNELLAGKYEFNKENIKALALSHREKSIEQCRKIGEYGLSIIEQKYKEKKGVVNILTHCNAGWLATVDYGTALAPVYLAHQKGIPVHVWVDETRPRNQGSLLTAFELYHEQIPHTIIVDNAGGLLMQQGMVDMVIVGTDRTNLQGEVVNKVGTYLKALAAYDNQIPFYVAAPSTSIDFENKKFIIEERNPDEVRKIKGRYVNKNVNVLIAHEKSHVSNFSFDITPSRLVSALITERGICRAERDSIFSLFPDKIKVS